MKPIEEILKVTGIEKSDCSTCVHLGTDDNGNYPEYAISWDVCQKNPTFENLKSFPFKKTMDCWHPEFWHSKKFTSLIKKGDHEEVLSAIESFNKAIDFQSVSN